MSKRIPNEPPIAWDRLEAMIDALRSGAELTGEMREKIARALERLFLIFHDEQEKSTPGRRRSGAQALNASLVHLLVENYGAPSIKAAACAVLPGDEKKVLALLRRYRKMKGGRLFARILADPNIVGSGRIAKLVATLPKEWPKKRK